MEAGWNGGMVKLVDVEKHKYSHEIMNDLHISMELHTGTCESDVKWIKVHVLCRKWLPMAGRQWHR